MQCLGCRIKREVLREIASRAKGKPDKTLSVEEKYEVIGEAVVKVHNLNTRLEEMYLRKLSMQEIETIRQTAITAAFVHSKQARSKASAKPASGRMKPLKEASKRSRLTSKSIVKPRTTANGTKPPVKKRKTEAGRDTNQRQPDIEADPHENRSKTSSSRIDPVLAGSGQKDWSSPFDRHRSPTPLFDYAGFGDEDGEDWSPASPEASLKGASRPSWRGMNKQKSFGTSDLKHSEQSVEGPDLPLENPAAAQQVVNMQAQDLDDTSNAGVDLSDENLPLYYPSLEDYQGPEQADGKATVTLASQRAVAYDHAAAGQSAGMIFGGFLTMSGSSPNDLYLADFQDYQDHGSRSSSPTIFDNTYFDFDLAADNGLDDVPGSGMGGSNEAEESHGTPRNNPWAKRYRVASREA